MHTETLYWENSLNAVKAKSNKNTYIFATDKQLNNQKYCKNFTTINEPKSIENILANDNHIYEMITKDNVKLYYDIDKLDLTRTQTDQFLNEFVAIINQELNIHLTRQELMVMCNDKKNKQTGEYSENIHSLHIIIPSYKMQKKQQKLLATYLNDKYDEIWEKYTTNDVFDIAVYNSNNQFRMINQSKMTNKIKLIDYNNAVIDADYIKKSRINYTYKTNQAGFLKTISPFESFSPNKELKELADNELVDFILTDDSIDNTKLMNKTRIWKLMTRLIMKKDSTLLYDVDKWSEKSAEISNNPHYTADKNRDYIERIKDEETFATNHSLYKIINDYSSKYNVYSQNQDIQYHTQEYLKEHFDDYDTIIEKILLFKNKLTKKLLKAVMRNKVECVINLATGFILCSGDTPPTPNNGNKIMGANGGSPRNMYCDNIPITTETLFESVNTIDEAKDRLIDFIKDGNKNVMVLKSRWGTGKTHNIINELLVYYGGDYKILMITESNALNSKLCKDYGFISHQDDKSTLDTHDKVVCSIQSLHRLQNASYDVVIIDEIQSILNAYSSSSTFKNLPFNMKAYNMYDLLLQKIKDSDKSLLCDADIQENYIKALQNTLGKDKMNVIKNTQPAFTDYKINIHTDYNDILNNLTNKILNTDYKIAVASASRAKIDEFVVDINKQILEKRGNPADPKQLNGADGAKPHKRIAVITSNGVKLYCNAIELPIKFNKQETLKDIDKFVINNAVDILFYSPTIKTGISFNTKDYFDYTFAFGECNSIVYCEFLQMLFRVRNLKQKELFVYLKESQFFCGKNSSLNETEYLQKVKNKVFQQLTNGIDIYDDECSQDYKPIQTINLNILQNTKYNYNQNLISLFKYHNLHYEYILPTTYEDKCDEIENDIATAKLVLQNKESNEWLQTPIMDIKKFFSFKKQIGEGKLNWNDLQEDLKYSYSKTKQLFIIHNITEDNIKDFYLQDGMTPKMLIDTKSQIKLDTCNNHDFFCKYIYKKTYNDVDYVRNIYCDKSIINTDYNQEDEKTSINNKLITRELLIMFNLLTEKLVFKPKTLTNQEFKSILTNVENTELVQKWYEMINPKVKNAVFNADDYKHVKKIYHFIKTHLSRLDIQLKYADANNTVYQSKSKNGKAGKMIFSQAKRFITYNEDKDLTIKPSASLEHLPNQAIHFPKLTKKDDKLVCIEDGKTIEILDDNKIKKLQNKIDNGETLEKRIMRKYIYSKIVQEYKPYTDPNEINKMMRDTPYYNAGFNMKRNENGKITLDYTDADTSTNKPKLKEYDIHTNLKTKQDYIITKKKSPIVKMNVYERGDPADPERLNGADGAKPRAEDAVKPYKSQSSKKVRQIAEHKSIKTDKKDEPIREMVSDLINCLIDDICIKSDLQTISCKA